MHTSFSISADMRTPISIGLFLILACAAAPALAEPVFWDPIEGGNAHFYEAIATPDGSTWSEARQAAEQRSWQGVAGQLASVTSAAENDWIWARFAESAGYWLGGFQQAGAGQPDAGWQWLSGDVWDVTAWETGQPNSFEEESRLQFAPATLDGRWNDDCSSCIGNGYIVEYTPTSTQRASRTWGLIKELF